MANKLSDLELKLDELYVRNTPGLPRIARKTLQAWMPVLALVASAVSLVTAYSMWHWAHATDKYIHGVCNAYSVSGCGNPVAAHLSWWLWVGVAFVGTEGLLYLLAYPGLRDRKKEGWDYLYYGVLLNVLYAVVSLFTEYNKISHFLGGLIVSAIGFYFVFQVRSLYIPRQRAMVITPKNVPKATVGRTGSQLADGFEQTSKKE